MSDPFYGLTAVDGLHVLKSKWGQKAYIREQSAYLADHLKAAVTNTEIPHRRQNYFPDHPVRESVDNAEAQWERAIWRRWSAVNAPLVPEGWKWIVYYQIPLYAERAGRHYRAIDLVGVDKDETLSIIELKKEPTQGTNGRPRSSESPLKMLLEAAAYAQVIRKNWKRFREDLAAHLQKTNPKIPCPSDPQKIRLVGVAPECYWLQWMPVSDQGATIRHEAWDAFRRLLNVLRDQQNLPTSFVSLHGSVKNWRSLTAKCLKNFPPDGSSV